MSVCVYLCICTLVYFFNVCFVVFAAVVLILIFLFGACKKRNRKVNDKENGKQAGNRQQEKQNTKRSIESRRERVSKGKQERVNGSATDTNTKQHTRENKMKKKI